MKRKPQQKKAWKHKCTGVVDISQEQKTKPINAKPKEKLPETNS